MASPFKSIESVLKLNSKATKLLQAKRYSKAIAAFSSCLSKVKDVLANHDETDDTCISSSTTTTRCDLSHFNFGFRFLSTSSSCSQVSLLSNEHSFSDEVWLDHRNDEDMGHLEPHHGVVPEGDCSMSFFQSPILIVLNDAPNRHPRRSSSSARHSTKPMEMISFALLNNLAICFHQSALKKHGKVHDDPQQQRQRRLNKALTLYKTAHRLIQDHEHTYHEELVGVVETMALLNNLGQVHWLLGQYADAHVCFERLLGGILWITHCGDRRTIFQYDLFFHNAMTHVLRPGESAPAA